MHRALLELTIEGVETSRDFHLRVMEDAEFRARRDRDPVARAAARRAHGVAAAADERRARRDRRGAARRARSRRRRRPAATGARTPSSMAAGKPTGGSSWRAARRCDDRAASATLEIDVDRRGRRRRRPHRGDGRVRAAHGAGRRRARAYRTREARSRAASCSRSTSRRRRASSRPVRTTRATGAADASSSICRTTRSSRRSGAIIGDALRRIGRRDVADPVVEPSDAPWRYRRKLTLHCAASATAGSPACIRTTIRSRVFDLARLSDHGRARARPSGASCAPRSTLLPRERALRVAVRLLDAAQRSRSKAGACGARRRRFFERVPAVDGALVASGRGRTRRVAARTRRVACRRRVRAGECRRRGAAAGASSSLAFARTLRRT